MSESPQNDRDGLKRLLARVPRRERGDVIAANIGEGAQNVAVGKFILQNNVRIGALVIPVRFILALLIVAAVVMGIIWFVVVPTKMPQDTFNVAVAEFGQMDKYGQVHGSWDGSHLSLWMFGKLRSEATTGLPKGTQVEIWHDSLGLLRKRSMLGVIATEAQAAQKAKEINAHMVIYGILDANQDPATFTPKFYVADVRSETAEVIGGQRLGAPIVFRPPVDFGDLKTSVYFDENLKPRAEMLVWFTWGLSFDLTGRHDQALQMFQEAERRFRVLPDGQGKEILYVFMGREAMFLARSEAEAKKAFNSAGDAIDFAERAFNMALTINPDYDRAHLWLGNAFSERAQKILATRKLGTEDLALVRNDLDTAAAQYKQALGDAESPDSVVGVRTQLSLGTLDYLRAAAYLLSGDNAAAEPLYQSAIDQMLKALPRVGPDQHRIRAQVYQTLGAAAFAQGHASGGDKSGSLELWQRAIAYYDECLAQARLDPYDAFLQSLAQQHCKPEREDVVKARDSLK